MYTRRQFGALTLGGLAWTRLATAGIDSRVAGVRLGAQSYSFRDLPRGPSGDAIDSIIDAFVRVGFGECELWAPQVEPPSGGLQPSEGARQALRAWRLETPLDHFRAIRKKFDAAGISIYAYNYSPNSSYTDAEIDRGFEMAKALGAGIITSSTTIEVAKRIAPFAENHKMVVAMHGHSNTSLPGEFAAPESFAEAMKMSKHFKVNLDIGHFTAANFDAVRYLREQHRHVTNLHIKDRKKNQGDNVPWGTGEGDAKGMLTELKRQGYKGCTSIEYEHGTVAELDENLPKCVKFFDDVMKELARAIQ